VSNYLNFLLI